MLKVRLICLNSFCFTELLHTLFVVFQEGGVFTFGAGGYGQLGHNSTSHEINPRKVFELMGSIVTQVACGR